MACLKEGSEQFCLRSTPIEWETPNSQIARVNLQLQFSAFFGYGQADAQPGYLGLQCHGLLWPVMDSDLPHYWPIAPPVVSGKVRGSMPTSCMTCDHCSMRQTPPPAALMAHLPPIVYGKICCTEPVSRFTCGTYARLIGRL